eukprot:14549230-Alexandrium_andersonii.AAC.1
MVELQRGAARLRVWQLGDRRPRGRALHVVRGSKMRLDRHGRRRIAGGAAEVLGRRGEDVI